MVKNKEFYQGIAIVLGWLARRGEDSLVEYAMNDNGLSLGDFKGVDSFDLQPIRMAVARDERDYEPTLRNTGFDDPPSLR